MNDNPSVIIISLRVPKALLDQFDALVRERAYKQGQRITRNRTLVELIQSAVQKQSQHTLLMEPPPSDETGQKEEDMP
jgi:metal-responsive CopG/Arc/MetJ family transcriptional regulator